MSPCRVRTRLVTRATGHARRGRSGGDLPRRRRHARRAALGHQHAVRAERPGRPQHRTEVARVGHAVERDDQRRAVRLRRGVEQVVVVRVLVRGHLDGDALVDRAVGQPVELGAADLEQRVVRVAGGADDLARAVVGLEARRDVDRGHRDARRAAPRRPSSGRRRSRASSSCGHPWTRRRCGSPTPAGGPTCPGCPRPRGAPRRSSPCARGGTRGPPPWASAPCPRETGGSCRPCPRWRPSWSCPCGPPRDALSFRPCSVLHSCGAEPPALAGLAVRCSMWHGADRSRVCGGRSRARGQRPARPCG